MKIPSFPKRILGFLIRGSLFSCLFFTGAALLIQSGLNAAQSSETFSIEANGLSSLGTATLQSGADIRFDSSTPNYTIGEGHDILLGRSLGEDEAKIRVALKSPTSLTASELAGAWKLHRFEKFGDIQFHTNSADFPVQAGTFTIDANRNAIASLGNDPVTFAVNASKDFMVSISPTPSIDSLFILVRLESGGTTSQMAGSWTLGSFGADFTENSTYFWYDGDTLTATAAGALTLREGPTN